MGLAPMTRWPGLLFLLLLLTGLPGMPLLAGAEPTIEEIEQNRRELAQKSPEEMARLRDNAHVFLALPSDRRERILKLDDELARMPLRKRERLLAVMQRYAVWLRHLKPEDRQKILEAADSRTRLEIVRQMREEEWLQRQPRAIREEIGQRTGAARAKQIAALRSAEQRRRHEWIVATRFWKDLQRKPSILPIRLEDLGREVSHFVAEYLKPRVTDAEWGQLLAAQGSWPRFPMTLVDLADRRPMALPGPHGPTSFQQLPVEVQEILFPAFKNKDKRKTEPKMLRALKRMEGTWPDFAKKITAMAKKRNKTFPNELWPYNVSGLSPQVRTFLQDKLRPVLTSQEALELLEAEKLSQWPDYPLILQNLASKHHLEVPWFTLPQQEIYRWDAYRITSP
jgi:hypothetical protein